MAGKQTDLTQGSVSRQLIKYALPVMATSMFQALYSLVDMLIVSRMIGPTGASGVSNAAQATHFLTQIAIGLATGGNIIVSQYFGSKDEKNRIETTGTFISLFAVLGIFVSAVSYLSAYKFLIFLRAPAFSEALSYLRVSTLGLVFVYGYNALASVLRALGNSKAPMHFILVSSVVNILLDLLFVGPLQMGTAGAALATVISQAVSFSLALIYVLRSKEIFEFSWENLKIRVDKALRILKVGIPCAIQMTIAGISWLTVTYLINDYGVIWSAANGFSAKIKDFMLLFITATTTASTSMIAQNLGAREFDRAKKTMFTAMRLTLSMAVIFITLAEILAPKLMSVFTDNPEVIAAGALNLRIEIISQLFYAVFLIFHSLMLGAGHSWWVFLSSFFNCILFRLIIAIIFKRLFGITGIFAACAIAPTVSIPIGIYYYRSNRWRRSLVSGNCEEGEQHPV